MQDMTKTTSEWSPPPGLRPPGGGKLQGLHYQYIQKDMKGKLIYNIYYANTCFFHQASGHPQKN